MKCKHCGQEIPEGSKFCLHCGHSLEPPIDSNKVEHRNLKNDIECEEQTNQEETNIQETSFKSESGSARNISVQSHGTQPLPKKKAETMTPQRTPEGSNPKPKPTAKPKDKLQPTDKKTSHTFLYSVIGLTLLGVAVWLFFINKKDSQIDNKDIQFYWNGTIGPSPAKIAFDGNQGSYSYLFNVKKGTWLERNISIESWDASTNTLRLTSHDTSGKYIGVFDGTYYATSYAGTFTNYKGVTIAFDFSPMAASAEDMAQKAQFDAFTTPDLVFAGVHGHVKKVTYSLDMLDMSSVALNKAGKLIDYHGSYFDELGGFVESECVNRDERGYITHIYYSTIGGISWKYDKRRKNISELSQYSDGASNTYKFVRDSEGKVVEVNVEHEEYEYNENMDEKVDTKTYKYPVTDYQVDDHGNWIQMRWNDMTQSRTITYYDPSEI